MDLVEQLQAWGVAHAQARSAEHAAQQSRQPDADLRREAKSLRDRADRLHREIYDALGRQGPGTSR